MLSARGIAVSRGGRVILSGVDFTVPKGQALILRGPNGIGKTSLLRTLAGLQPAAAGQIESHARQVAYASHKDGIKAQLTVGENLAFWAALYGGEVSDALLQRFDLAALRDRLAGTLSAGQARRLGLARLGVIGCDLLLLDEPTVSLDVASTQIFADFLREAHLARGGSAVIATHIELGIQAPVLELAPFAAAQPLVDEAFL